MDLAALAPAIMKFGAYIGACIGAGLAVLGVGLGLGRIGAERAGRHRAPARGGGQDPDEHAARRGPRGRRRHHRAGHLHPRHRLLGGTAMALLRVDPGLVIWLWITFGIILLILRLTVWGQDHRRRWTRGRRRSPRTSSRRARPGRRPARCSPSTTRRSARARPRPRASSRRRATRPRGSAKSILQQSQAEARELKERAAQEIERAREDAERALRGQVVSLSFSIADSILKRETGNPGQPGVRRGVRRQADRRRRRRRAPSRN